MLTDYASELCHYTGYKSMHPKPSYQSAILSQQTRLEDVSLQKYNCSRIILTMEIEFNDVYILESFVNLVNLLLSPCAHLNVWAVT